VRRIALRSNRNRRQNLSTEDRRNQLPHLGNSPRRRGVSPEEIRALPRVKWADIVKCEAVKIMESSSAGSGGGGGGDAEAATAQHGATARAEGTSKPEEMEEADVCSVCLGEYEAGDLLIRLPCEHLFHEACIGRWLETDSTCPKCRFHIGWLAAQGPNRRHVRPLPGGIDEEAGIELDDVRRAAAAAREHATALRNAMMARAEVAQDGARAEVAQDGARAEVAQDGAHDGIAPSPRASVPSPPSQAAPPVVVQSTGVQSTASSHPEPRMCPAPSPEA
jgi:hypothetical protein